MALTRHWLLAMGWTRDTSSPDSQPVLETNSNKIMGKLYSLNKTNVSIWASKLHCPKSSRVPRFYDVHEGLKGDWSAARMLLSE